MTNYEMDEIERQRERERRSRGIRPENKKHSVKIGDSEMHSYKLEIDDEQFLQLAKRAAKHNITFNQMVNVTLLNSLNDDDYQFEHPPQLLNED